MRICNCSNSNFFVILALSHVAVALFSYYYFFFHNRHDQLVEFSLQTTKLEAVVNNIDMPEGPYKFFYFALTWPGSYTPRREKVPKNFTIHGLWPNCKKPCHGTTFNESQIANITAKLKEEWPSVDTRKTNKQFWKHEWEKHGTCSEDVLDQFNYFNSALRLKSHIDILQTLKNKGVTPNMTIKYNLTLIEETLKDIKTATIKCDNTTSPDVLLLEIRFCVNHKGTSFIPCEYKRLNCTRDTIKFPTTE